MKKIMSKLVLAVAVTALIAAVPAQAKKKATSNKATSSQVIYTGEIAKKVYGYNGTTPLNIHLKNGKIEKIEALENQETPQYFQRAIKKIFPLYEGKTVAEALSMDVDAVSGATYSSEAVIKNIRLGLEQAQPAAKKKTKNGRRH